MSRPDTMCKWEDCDQEAVYCEGHAHELVNPLGYDIRKQANKLKHLEGFVKEIRDAWQGHCDDPPFGKNFEDNAVFYSISDVLNNVCRECGESPCNGHKAALKEQSSDE